jgi:CheY-like chemotaxis protein
MDSHAKILLVEDHRDTAELMQRVLRLCGYEVCLAGGVGEALAAANSQEFDLALCDIGLPDGDGCDLMHQLRSLHELDGIALTAHAMPAEMDRVQNAGFQRFLTKPIALDTLRAAIENCLVSRSGAPTGI